MKILSIETSCDETAMALVEAKGGLEKPHFKILKNLVASQIKIHEPYGGVVPYLAKREHEKNLPILFKKIFNLRTSDVLNIDGGNFGTSDVQKLFRNIDLICVTVGPGLEPCLWEGINFAKNLLKTKNYQLKANLIGVNHLEGHLYSFLLNKQKRNFKFQISNFKKLFPAIALIVSGGHTILLLMKNLTDWKKLGETRDDAAGEAFDKVARLLNLPYPGGPNLEKIAKLGNPNAVNFPRPMIHQKNYDFSFSGLKTAVLYYLRDRKNLRTSDVLNIDGGNFGTSDVQKLKNNIAASFQAAAFDVLISKTLRAAREFKAQSILLSGGVANNKSLRRTFRKEAQKKKINFFTPSLEFTTDNAAMTAVAAYFNYLKNKKSRLIAQANLNLYPDRGRGAHNYR